MKIVKIDKQQKDKNMDYLKPIIRSAIALGITSFLIITGKVNYNNLIDLDSIKNLLDNIPIPNILINKKITFDLIKMIIKTIGIQGVVLASRAYDFTRSIAKPVMESDAVKENPIICKIKRVSKGKRQDRTPTTYYKLIKDGLSIGTMVYLIATHQIDYNTIYNLDNLPHKFSVISKMARNIDFNKIHIGVLSIEKIRDFIKNNKNKEVEKKPISFSQLLKEIGKGVLPQFTLVQAIQQKMSKRSRKKIRTCFKY